MPRDDNIDTGSGRRGDIRASARASPTRTGSVPRWPMVARDDEFGQAMAALGPDTELRGVALIGESGVGKSVLARALGDALEADGHTVRYVLGTETGGDVPLGAFSRSVTVDTAHEPAAMLAAAYQVLERQQNLVCVVDDAQLLDPLSATLVNQLAVGGAARLVVTIRSGEPVFDAVSTLMKDRLLRTVRIGVFTREQTGALVGRVLGDAVESRVIDELHARSGGNLFLLRGLLTAGQDAGVLVRGESGWQLRGPLRPDREILDLVGFRLRSLTTAERDAVEILAAGELLDWTVLRELCDADAVAHLERRGLIQLVADGPEMVARLNHPVFGEAVIQLAGVVRSRQLNGILAQALQRNLDAGGRHARLPDIRGQIRLAQFMMRSDIPPNLEVIVSAASSAMNLTNLGHAEELARFAFDRGGGLPAALVLADTLSWQGRCDEAETILAEADPGDADELLTVRWACLRAGNLFWNCRDVAFAGQVLADIGDRVETEVGVTLVRALQVTFGFFAGDLATTIEAGPPLCTSDVVPLAATWAAVPTSFALAFVGRFDDAHRIAQAGLRADALCDSGPQRFATGLAEVLALTTAGEHRAAERAVERYAAMAAGVPEADAMVLAIRALVHGARGQLAPACSALDRAIAMLPQGFPSSWVMLVTAWLAQEEGARGNAAAAAAALRRSEASYGPQAAVFRPELELARAWERVAAGQVSAGRTLAVGAAQIAQRSGMHAVEMRALHTAVRFGDRSHAQRLAELGATLNTPLAQTVAAHAQGLADHDGDRLDAVAYRFSDIGALGLAADASAQAAVTHARDGHRAKHLEAAARAHWLASQGDIQTPAVNDVALPLPITDREREIAVLVAAGLSNRETADQLSVSVRTVEGHLYRIFAKLGIERRDQLVQLIRDLPSGT